MQVVPLTYGPYQIEAHVSVVQLRLHKVRAYLFLSRVEEPARLHTCIVINLMFVISGLVPFAALYTSQKVTHGILTFWLVTISQYPLHSHMLPPCLTDAVKFFKYV